ncbi:MAG: phosphoribosylglycinamide formyltransferase [Nitrospirota bacterium]
MLRIGVLASGRGSNFQSLIDAIERGAFRAEIALLITDNPSAFAIERAGKHGVEYRVMRPEEYASRDEYYRQIADTLKTADVGLVVLAGFMRIVGKPLIEAFPDRVMNIHPALLPSFPGLHGQKQALEYGAKVSGCTVHFVDEGVDTGPIIIQAAVPVLQGDTEDSLSARILEMEHKIYPEAVRLFSEGRIEVRGRQVRVKKYAAPHVSFTNPPLGS